MMTPTGPSKGALARGLQGPRHTRAVLRVKGIRTKSDGSTEFLKYVFIDQQNNYLTLLDLKISSVSKFQKYNSLLKIIRLCLLKQNKTLYWLSEY